MTMSSNLSKVSKIYRLIGVIFIVLGLFLLVGSIIAAANGEKVSNEPFFGVYSLSGGLFMLFAGYIGQAIDDIRNNIMK